MSWSPHRKSRKSSGAGRRWILYGVNPEQRVLLLQCLETLELGTVESEDSSDWILGCKATQHPDVWSDPSRVQPTGFIASLPYVVEDHYGDDCGCVEYNRRTRFHHLPAEMLDGTWFPWLGSRQLAKTLADHGPFCSNQLALAFRALQIDIEEDQATSWVLDRLSATRDRGVHIPPCVLQACLNIGVVESLAPEGHVLEWDPAINDWRSHKRVPGTRQDDEDDHGDDDDDDDDDDGDDPGDDGGDSAGGNLLEAPDWSEPVTAGPASWWQS